MPQEERTAPVPPPGRDIAVAVGEGAVDGEAPPLVVVSFYRFADFPDHAAFRHPLKELCEDLVREQRSQLSLFVVACDILDAC
jgi:hypothetical protein